MINNSKMLSDSTLTASIQWGFSWPELAGENERHYLFSYLEGRFGIPEEVFDNYLLFKREKSWMLVRNAPQMRHASQLKISRLGLKAFRKIGAFIKPTTRMIQVFGHAAIRAGFEINQEQLLRLLEGGEIPVDSTLDKGYVILTFGENQILGIGFLVNGKVRSQIPKKELKQVMVHAFTSPKNKSCK